MKKLQITRVELENSRESHKTVSTKYQAQIQQTLINVPYRSMQENEELIVRVMESAIAPLTRAKIARLIGRKKQPNINRLIEGLVEKGILCKYVVRRPNGVDMYLYERNQWE